MAQKTTFAVLGHPLTDFPGATVSGSLPIREHVVNSLVLSKDKPDASFRLTQVEILDNNRLAVSASIKALFFTKNLRVELEVERGIDFQRSPLLKIHVAQSMALLGLIANALGKLPDFVTFVGQEITIDLQKLLQKRGYAELQPHIKTVEIITQKGLLTLNFLVRVDA